jgi:methanogenic corrinoid protein MtbC1
MTCDLIEKLDKNGAGILTFSDEDKDHLCHLLISGGPNTGVAIMNDMVSSGLSRRDLYLKVLSPIARHFDTLWHEDRATFLGVSIAATRMQTFLFENGYPISPVVIRTNRQAVFASLPGEAHTIGVKMAADLQRSKGWDIHLVTNAPHNELLYEIERSPAGILGLSIASRASMGRLYSLVKALRISRPSLKILVSGSLVTEAEHQVQLLGVDACATSFEQAELMLDDLAAGHRLDEESA